MKAWGGIRHALVVLALLAGVALGAPAAQASAPEDDARALAVAQAVQAFESFGLEHGNYIVSGGGGSGDGQGWYQYTDNTHYPTSIAQVLVAEGHLPATYLTDPADTNRDHHLRVGSDFLIYRCKNRIGVFAKPSSAALVPTAADETWWTNNGCIDYPISAFGHTYFALTTPLDSDSVRWGSMQHTIDALESFATDYGTFNVLGAGGSGDGQGWLQYTDNAHYQTSIAEVLQAQGHMRSRFIADPLDQNPDHHLRVGRDFLVYRCLDRVAVFGASDHLEAGPEDAAWWSANDCIDYPIVTFGFSNFHLSRPLGELLLCGGETPTVNLALGQLPTDGDDIIVGTPGPDLIDAGDGDDIICALSGDDVIHGGAGDDLIWAGLGTDQVFGGPGADTAVVVNEDDALDSYDGGGAPSGQQDTITVGASSCKRASSRLRCPVGWTRLM